MDAVFGNFDVYLTAFGYTLLLFLVSGFLSLVWGTILAAMRVGPVAVLRWAGAIYVTLVRNTPLVIVFGTFTFTASHLWEKLNFRWFSDLDIEIGPFDFSAFFALAVISLTLYTAAFVCEALRSGINGVPLGQAEAGRAIGLPFGGVMTNVVLPQAFRHALPPLASVQIALIKNTSVAAVFGVAEAVSRMRSFTNDFSTERIGIFIMFALGYIVIVEVTSFVANRMERRWRVAT